VLHKTASWEDVPPLIIKGIKINMRWAGHVACKRTVWILDGT
jgi:hypothetical protein